MSNKHLRRQPHNIGASGQPSQAWWYEESRGIMLYQPARIVTTPILIRWESLRRALARKDQQENPS